MTGAVAASRVRLRIKAECIETGWVWYAAQVNELGDELSRSPDCKNEVEAEQYLNNFKTVGAWLKS